MKYLLLPLLCLALLSSIGMAGAAEKTKPAKETGRLHHVVAFKFKKSATAAQIVEVEEAFRALKKKIPVIVNLEWGTNVSPEKHDKGFTHGFLLTFKSAKDRDAYLIHPDHQAFGKVVGPVLDDVFVIDFWGKK
jgi:hypothetical protein